MIQLEIGDIVRCNEHIFNMVVVDIDFPKVECLWYNVNDEEYIGTFNKEELIVERIPKNLTVTVDFFITQHHIVHQMQFSGIWVFN